MLTGRIAPGSAVEVGRVPLLTSLATVGARITYGRNTMDSLNSLTVFVQVVDSGSFAAAARQLGISASAVGKSIARLEERASTKLVHRTSRSLRLTPEGQRTSTEPPS